MKFVRVAQIMEPGLHKNFPLARESSIYATPLWKQVAILIGVKIKLMARDKKGLRMRMGMAVAQSIILGIAFYDIASSQERCTCSSFSW